MILSAASRLKSGGPSCIAAAILCVLLVAEPLQAQSSQALFVDAPQQAAEAPKVLHIVILEGEDALNNIRDRTAREPIVRIEDENHRPVAGALVLFSLNSGSSGAGGAFSGLSSLSITTGADGRAVARGFQANQISGQFSINVQATLGSLATTAIIAQTNGTATSSQSNPSNSGGTVATIKKSSAKRSWLIASGAVAAVIIVVILGTHTAGTTITAGAGSVHQ